MWLPAIWLDLRILRFAPGNTVALGLIAKLWVLGIPRDSHMNQWNSMSRAQIYALGLRQATLLVHVNITWIAEPACNWQLTLKRLYADSSQTHLSHLKMAAGSGAWVWDYRIGHAPLPTSLLMCQSWVCQIHSRLIPMTSRLVVCWMEARPTHCAR